MTSNWYYYKQADTGTRKCVDKLNLLMAMYIGSLAIGCWYSCNVIVISVLHPTFQCEVNNLNSKRYPSLLLDSEWEVKPCLGRQRKPGIV